MYRKWFKSRLRAASLLTTAMMGCGEATVDSRFAGKPIMTVEGKIDSFDGSGVEVPIEKPLRAALFWSKSGKFDLSEANIGNMVVDPSVIVGESFPMTFRVHIFKPPQKELLIGGKYALGMIFLYEDVVGDHRYIHGKTPIRGGALDSAILYAPERIDTFDSPINFGIEAGMSDIPIPVDCELNATEEEDAKNSTFCERLSIGNACANHADCGTDGTCLKKRSLGHRFPHGYCAVRESDTSCVPVDTVKRQLYFTEKKKGETFYMGVCDSDFECRTDEGYRCDPFLRFCSPPMPVLLRVSADFEPTELCDQDIEEPEDVDSEVEPDDIESTGGSDTGEEITSLNSGS